MGTRIVSVETLLVYNLGSRWSGQCKIGQLIPSDNMIILL